MKKQTKGISIYTLQLVLDTWNSQSLWNNRQIFVIFWFYIPYHNNILNINAFLQISNRKGRKLWKTSQFFVFIRILLFCISKAHTKMAIPGEGNGNPLQDSCLEKSTDTGAWRAVSTGLDAWACVHEGGRRWVGSSELVELKKKKSDNKLARS